MGGLEELPVTEKTLRDVVEAPVCSTSQSLAHTLIERGTNVPTKNFPTD